VTPPTYINVEPVLNVGGKLVPCKEISLITVISKCMGKMKEWPARLENLSDLGYNAVHFTPIQQYGSSDSHYSLKDQTDISDYFFDIHDMPRQERLDHLSEMTQRIRDEFGMLSVVDIVLNHTSPDSPWLKEHPEAAYNTDTCPHLNSGYILDKALDDFSKRFAEKKVPECPSAPFISTE